MVGVPLVTSVPQSEGPYHKSITDLLECKTCMAVVLIKSLTYNVTSDRVHPREIFGITF